MVQAERRGAATIEPMDPDPARLTRLAPARDHPLPQGERVSSHSRRSRGVASSESAERGHGPDQRVEPIGRAAGGKTIGAEIGHLVLERGQRADVGDPALLVKRGDRLGAQNLAARGAHFLHRNIRVDFRKHGAHHFAALVHFDHDAVGLQPAIERNRAAGPGERRETLRALVAQNINALVGAESGGDDAAGVGAFARRRGRIDRHHHAHQRGRRAHAAGLEEGALEQRVGALLDDLAFQLLPPEPRAGIARDHALEERGREIVHVRAGGRVGERGLRIGDQPLQAAGSAAAWW